MANTPITRKIYHPACGQSYFYVLIRKRFTREVTDENGQKSMLRVKVYMCRHCGEEFSDLDIMEHEAGKPQVNLSEMTPEERRTFINNLFKKDSNGRPS